MTANPNIGDHLSVSAVKLADKCSLADTQAAWMAAIIDAEGSISMQLIYRTSCGKRKPGWVVRMTVTNTDLRLLRAIMVICEGKISGPHQNRSDSIRAKPRYHWQGGATVCRAILPAIRPWLVCKGEHADLAIAALGLKAGYTPIAWTNPDEVAKLEEHQRQLNEIAAQLTQLNTRGVQP